MVHLHKVNVNVQGSVAQKPQKLRFRRYLVRHQIDNGYLQRAYILMQSSLVANDKYILVLKRLERREVVRYLDRHAYPAFL